MKYFPIHLFVLCTSFSFQFPITALREIRILQLLRHDNVVHLYEICRTKPTQYNRWIAERQLHIVCSINMCVCHSCITWFCVIFCTVVKNRATFCFGMYVDFAKLSSNTSLRMTLDTDSWSLINCTILLKTDVHQIRLWNPTSVVNPQMHQFLCEISESVFQENTIQNGVSVSLISWGCAH